MKNTKLIITVIVILLVVLNIGYFTLNNTREGNALKATNFVKNEATYKFDAMPDTFELSSTIEMECSYCWEFTFKYQSRNSGYGDRTDAVTNPVITNHVAKIVMENGDVNSAVLDGVWDLKTEATLIQPTSNSPRRRPR